MNLLFAVAALASIVPAYMAWQASKATQGMPRRFLKALAVIHAVNTLTLAFWANMPSSNIEALHFTDFFLGAQTALVAGTLAIALKQQRLSWMLLAYLLGAPLIVFQPATGFLVLGITSALILAIFATLAIIQGETRICMATFVAAAATTLASLLGSNTTILAMTSTISSIALAFLYRELHKPLASALPERKQVHTLTRNIARFAILVPLLTIFLLGVTVAVHEFAHAFAATAAGCEYSQAILYEQGFGPHATVQCENTTNRVLVGLAGTITPLIVALMFVLIGQELTTILAIYMAGFSFIFSYGDAQILGFPTTAIFLSTVVGFSLLILGIVKLSLFFLKE
jgi:hypothetical protein